MSLYAIGLNHRTAPIDVRECLAFPVEALRQSVESLRRHSGADEAMLVSTCNRTELYLRATPSSVIDGALRWLTGLPTAQGKSLEPHLYQLTDAAVPRHAFRVACGLDSMVLGEPQILGQMKVAAQAALEAKTLSGPLNRMVQETLSVAKEVRTGTALGKTSVSMAAIAAKLAQQIFGDLDQVRLLLIGAGEMIELTATHFAALSPKDITIANRTLSRGTALAQKFDAHATALDQLPHTLHQYDVVISSTASSLPLIGKGMVERAMIARKRKPLFLVDLAMPRDIEPEVSKIDGVFLHSLDSLGRIAGENLEIRQSAIEDAQRIIDRRTADFMHWLDRRSAVPVIQKLREKAEQDAAHEIARGKKLIAGGADPAEVLAMVARALTNKHLHRPLTALQRATGQGDDTTAAWIEALFIGSDEMKM